MIIKTLQWNIGGGLIRDKHSNKLSDISYDVDGLKYIINVLKEINPDIVTLQETHESKTTSQTKDISRGLGMSFYALDSYDNSHLNEKAKLSQSIISRYPLSNHKYQKFINPGYKVLINGKEYPCHDKGVTSTYADIDGDNLHLETLHLLPFGRTSIDPLGKEAREYRDDISSKISTDSKRLLLQGDFNFDNESLKPFIPNIFSKGTKEILQTTPTRATGKHYDHVVYRGLKFIKSTVLIDTLTDHFPIVAEFELS